MRLYNSLSRTIESISPLDGSRYRIYSCGPTVYDHAHIGNLSAYVFADTLRRVLASGGHAPLHVMNYTDVDDKTIRRSLERYAAQEPREALRLLTDDYIAKFRADMAAVGTDLEAITFTRATDHIDDMQAIIRELLAADMAYVADDGIYFSIEAYRHSGRTYGQLVELTLENTGEARIDNDEYDKESVHDFALWKVQKAGEPAWAFEVDGRDMAGRPGWHIECSAMSRQALGQPFDVHTGGIDLKFPHHENEIAQSTAAISMDTMASVFAHNDHILVDGKKMAKSANNFYTLSDITAKGHDPLAFRLLVLQSHYRHPVNFSWESLEAASNRLQALRAFADLRFQLTATQQTAVPDYMRAIDDITAALRDDVATPQALQLLSGLIDEQSAVGLAGDPTNHEAFLRQLDELLGLRLLDRSDITSEQKAIVRERDQARGNKDWAASDRLRDTLGQQGIGLNDTPQGSVWYRL